MKTKILTLIVVLFVSFSFTNAQITKKDVKRFDKSVKLFNKGKYEKALELIDPIVLRNPSNSTLWAYKIEYMYKDYVTTKSLGNFVIVTSDGDIASAKMLQDLLNNAFGSAIKKHNLLVSLKKCTRYCNDGDLESVYRILRAEFIDTKYPVDTAISEESKEIYTEAEQQFWNRNFNNAAELYDDALNIEPDYYKARLYLGDSYFSLHEYERAAPIFKECADRFPDLLEPQKYYADALEGMEEYKKALDASIEGVLRFPDVGMFMRMEDYADEIGKEFNREWIARPCPVNVASDTIDADDLPLDNIPEYWKYYFEAKGKIAKHTDKQGLLSTNSITEYSTLEAYCWDYMLERAEDDIEELAVAREMKESGQLEAYVLISLFHYDLFDQFKHYVGNNKTAAVDYLNSLVK